MIDLAYVLRRAGAIVWRHKSLWLLGLLASVGGVGRRLGTGGGSGGRVLAEYQPPQWQRFFADPGSGFYVVLVILGLALGLALMVLNALGQAGLVDQVRAAEERGAISVKRGWEAGRRHFWPVFLIRLLSSLPVIGITLAGALPVLGAALATALMKTPQERPEVVIPGVLATELAIFACLLPALCVAVVLSIPLNVLQRLSVCACILQEDSVRGSIERAWQTLRAHAGPLALLWLSLLCIAIASALVLGLPFLLVLLTVTVLAWTTAFFSPLLSAGATLAVGIGTWLVVAASRGVIETFNTSAWTLAYRELSGLGLTGDPAKVDNKDVQAA